MPYNNNNARAVVDIQYASTQRFLPTQADICTWIDATLALTGDIFNASHKNQHEDDGFEVELTVRIVDEEEGVSLNREYRGQETATNVLSFPCELSTVLDLNLLGDIVICAPVVKREISMQHDMPFEAYWAHMVIHGVLHLLGYDHQSETEARYMESIEMIVLAQLGFTELSLDPLDIFTIVAL